MFENNVAGILDQPPAGANYGPSQDPSKSCGSCIHYGMALCDLWNAKTRTDRVCNEWDAFSDSNIQTDEGKSDMQMQDTSSVDPQDDSGAQDATDTPDMPVAPMDHEADSNDELNDRQETLYDAVEHVAYMYGKFDQGSGPDGAHYSPKSPFSMKCSDCVYFRGGQKCEVVEGTILPDGICKLWIIPGKLVSE